MDFSPKPIVILGSGPGGFTGILTDANGVVFVSPPTALNISDVEVTAAILNVSSTTFSGGFESLATLAVLYGTNALTGFTEQLNTETSNADGLAARSQGNLLTLSSLLGWNGSTYDRIWGRGNNVDALAAEATGNLASDAFGYGWNGASFDRIRVANIFKTVTATASGATNVWTPTAGKKFRLMGYTISCAGTLAATGVQTLQLLDNATVIKNHAANMIQTTTVSISGGDTQIGADLGNGQLSAAANNVLKISLGTAMATGEVAVNAWGTEE
jgi:hypothetical protein